MDWARSLFAEWLIRGEGETDGFFASHRFLDALKDNEANADKAIEAS